MDSPEISVVLPFYNAEAYLAEAIQSILDQTFNHFELILLNDGSTDNSMRVVKSFTDQRIVVVENEKNAGLICTLNKGLELSKGRYIARMDADDISMPDRLQQQYDFMQVNESVIVCGTQAEFFGNMKGFTQLYEEDDEIKANLLHGPCFVHPTVMFRSDIIKQHNIRYSNTHVHMEDYDLWLRIFKLGKFANLNSPLLKYRVGEQNITQKNKLTRESRLKQIYGDILLMFEIEPNDKNKTHMLELTYNTNSVQSYSQLNRFRKELKIKNDQLNVFNKNVFTNVVSQLWSRIFYKAADNGFKGGINYFLSGGKFSFSKFKYLFGGLRKK